MANRFNDLKGIGKEKKKIADNLYLKKIFETYEEIVKESYAFLQKFRLHDTKYMENLHYFVFDTTSKRINEGEISKQILEDYLIASPLDGARKDNDWLKGIYTGCLLELICQYKKGKEDHSIIHFDGRGMRYDNLFMFARNMTNVVIENYKGGNICFGVGIGKGEIGSLQLFNIDSEYGIAGSIDGGNAGLISIINCKGDYFGSSIANKGSIDCLYTSRCVGNHVLSEMALDGEIKLSYFTDYSETFKTKDGNTYNYCDLTIIEDFAKSRTPALFKIEKAQKIILKNVNGTSIHNVKGDISPHKGQVWILDSKELKKKAYAHGTLVGREAKEEYFTLPEYVELDQFSRISEQIKEKQALDTMYIAKKILENYQQIKAKGVFND